MKRSVASNACALPWNRVSETRISFESALIPVSFSGTIDPEMSTALTLSNTLFGRTRGALLAVLFGHVGETYYLRQLARMTGIAVGAVQRELRRLVDAGLVVRTASGTQILYRANEASPVYADIRELVAKTVGIRDVLLDAVRPLERSIRLAFVYGSVARARETQQSDIDLMVVGKVRFEDVVDRLTDARKKLNREINPTVYGVAEFRTKARGNFLKSVFSEKKLFIVGDENVLRELGQQQVA